MNLCLVAIGGAFGSAARYLVVMLANRVAVGAFPFGVLIVNSVGSLLIGIVAAYLTKAASPSVLSPLIITGFLGGFTTFSSYALDCALLFSAGNYKLAILNFLANNGICLAMAWLGFSLGRNAIN